MWSIPVSPLRPKNTNLYTRASNITEVISKPLGVGFLDYKFVTKNLHLYIWSVVFLSQINCPPWPFGRGRCSDFPTSTKMKSTPVLLTANSEDLTTPPLSYTHGTERMAKILIKGWPTNQFQTYEATNSLQEQEAHNRHNLCVKTW